MIGGPGSGSPVQSWEFIHVETCARPLYLGTIAATEPADSRILFGEDSTTVAEISSSSIAPHIGVSRWYAGRIRRGYRPHARHWQALGELIGLP
jgi:hypothetical protein